MEAAEPRDQRVAGAQHQMIGVAQDDLGVHALQVAVHERLHRALRPHRHKGRGVEPAVRRLDPSETRLTIGCVQ